MAATALAVQFASFKGIYTLPGGVFIPGNLVWSHPDKVNGNEFVNARGKVFLLINNKSADQEIILTLDATVSVAETPDSIAVTDPVLTIPFGESQVVGPFSGNFEAVGTGKIGMAWSGDAINTDVDVAVVKLP